MEPIPEQSDDHLDFDLAGPGARLGARVIDVAMGFMTFVVTLIFVVVAYDIELTDDPDTLTIPDNGALILRWVPILIWGLYEVLLTLRTRPNVGQDGHEDQSGRRAR